MASAAASEAFASSRRAPANAATAASAAVSLTALGASHWVATMTSRAVPAASTKVRVVARLPTAPAAVAAAMVSAVLASRRRTACTGWRSTVRPRGPTTATATPTAASTRVTPTSTATRPARPRPSHCCPTSTAPAAPMRTAPAYPAASASRLPARGGACGAVVGAGTERSSSWSRAAAWYGDHRPSAWSRSSAPTSCSRVNEPVVRGGLAMVDTSWSAP